MRSLIVAAATGLAALAGASSPAAADTAELFGRADAVWDAQVSPDERHVALGCSPSGAKAVCIYNLVEDSDPILVFPGPEMRIESYYWASDEYLVTNVSYWEVLKTAGGLDEFTARRAVSFNLKTRAYAKLMRDVGIWDDLTRLSATCQNDPGKVIMSITTRMPDGFFGTAGRITNRGFRTLDYEVNLKTGKTRKWRTRAASVVQTVFDQECQPIAQVLYNDEKQEFAIDVVEGKRRIFELDDVQVEPMEVVGKSSEQDALIVRADFEDTYGMFSMSLADGAMVPIEYEGVELGRMGVVRDTFSDSVLGFRSTDDIETHLYIDQELVDLQALVEGALPGQTARVVSFSRDRGLYTIEAEAPGVPTSFFLYDVAARELSPLGALAPQVEGRALGSIEAVTYEARDGLVIPAYLTLPPGKTREDGPFPTVLLPHGGPEARDTARFNWWSQAYAAAGYAVIQPNFRGSAGYGKAFRDAGFGEFGGKMVDDVVDAIAWAEAEGIADPRGVCVAGASYGGYSALMTGLKAPEKVGCVVAVAPVTNPFGHMARYEKGTDPYRYWSRYVGDDIFADDTVRTALSPEMRASEYGMPVLLIHGKDDYIVELQQSKRFSNRWGDRPGLTYVEMDGQDHFLTSTVARHTVLSQSLALLAAHHPARAALAPAQ